MYKPEELVEADGKKRKGNGRAIEEPQTMKKVNDEETMEFIKTLKRNEYLVVAQLKKLPAQISILSLLFSSKEHREALL